MREKLGFTLAEVLITLGLIGILSVMVIPVLTNNTSEKQAVTAFQKSLETLSNIGMMTEATNGFNYSTATFSNTATRERDKLLNFNINSNDMFENGALRRGERSLLGMLLDKGMVDIEQSKRNSGDDSVYAKYPQVRNGYYYGCNLLTINVFFRDGSVLCYPKQKRYTSLAGDNVSYINAVIDTNGTNGPNLVSQCGDKKYDGTIHKIVESGDDFKLTDDDGNDVNGESGDDETDACNDPDRRQIYDQFNVVLVGPNARPGRMRYFDPAGGSTRIGNYMIETQRDHAARWAARQ